MHNSATSRRPAALVDTPSTLPGSDRRPWQRRRALYARRAARAEGFYRTPQGGLPEAEDIFAVLADQHHAALALLLATPAPTLSDAVMKLELYLMELVGTDADEGLRHILADLKRLVKGA